MISARNKLSPLPDDTEGSVIAVRRGFGTLFGKNPEPIVIVSIGRPVIEETEGDEMVGSHAMRISGAAKLIQDLSAAIHAALTERSDTGDSQT